MLNKVKSYMQKNSMVNPGDTLVVGVSGGADSVCLLLVLQELSVTMDFEVTVVHVEHGMRGADSLADAAFVKTLCAKRGIPFRCVSFSVPELAKEWHMSEEEAGRKVRYESFREEAKKYKQAKIAVAHNQNDCAETMLFQLSRGCGVSGLCGISPVNGDIIRPLLCVSRQEIETYLDEKKQSFCVDTTNSDTSFSRNRIRHNVLPQLIQINGQAVEHFCRTAALMEQVERYLDRQTEEAFKQCVKRDGKSLSIFVSTLERQEELIQSRVILEALSKVAGQKKDLTQAHVEQVWQLCRAQTGKQLSLSYGITVFRQYERICIRKCVPMEETENVSVCRQLEMQADSKMELGGYRFSFQWKRKEKESMLDFKKSCTKYLDCDKIKNSLILRTRQDEDYIIINGNGQKQKLNRFFINEKIPRSRRDEILLLADGHQILWIVGYRMSEAHKVSEHTQKILQVDYETC